MIKKTIHRCVDNEFFTLPFRVLYADRFFWFEVLETREIKQYIIEEVSDDQEIISNQFDFRFLPTGPSF